MVRSQVDLEVLSDEDDDWDVGEARGRRFRFVGLPDLMGE